MIDLHVEGKAEALRVVQKLHRNLGHPSPQSLVDLLSSRGASQSVLQVAGSYVCASCQRYKKPNQPTPAAMPTVEHFNEQVQADVFWIKPDDHPKMPILSIVDSATKYQSATLVPNEQSHALITGLERAWVAHFGPPECLISDEGRGWLSEPMTEWTDSQAIKHQVAPGEAHERLAIVERRHAVLRKSLEIYMHDLQLTGPEGVRQALAYVIRQLNSQPTVSGYSPAQWLLGYQPSMSGLLTSDQITPVHLGGNTTFEEALLRRNAAKTAILSADTDRRLRRALLRRYAGDNIRLAVGQTVYYWRDAQSPDLCKICWKGPAKVLMVEENEQGLPSVYWICHKSQLIRCAPHHCRPDFHHISQNIVDNLIEAKELLRSLKSRGVTRFLDLNKVNRQHIDDVEEDEQIFSDDDDGENAAKRRRLDLALGPAPPSITYSPSVADTADLSDQEPHSLPPAPPLGLMEQDPPQAVEPNLEEVDISDLLSGDEPLAEPDRPPTPAVPSSSPATGLSGSSLTFLQQRQQHEQLETQALFGPQRHQPRAHGPSPYERPPEDFADANVAFQVEDADDSSLPCDWKINHETGYFELKSGSRPKDFWTLQAGCLIRHHMHKRTNLFDPTGTNDSLVPLDRLDPIRVTVFHTKDGQALSHTDNFNHPGEHPCGVLPKTWHGMTIFQINAETRQELGMAATDSTGKSRNKVTLHSAKKIGQSAKTQAKRQFRRTEAAKNKGEVNEKHLSQAEKDLFYQAKVKELKSFFECGVWEFSTTEEAVPERTLSSRILLKWNKNSDGSPRAKARLAVCGYNDVDALSGNLDTASPTTSRLARSLLLCVSANLRWKGWSADVSTAFLQGLPQERQLWLQLPKEALEILGAPSNTRMFLRKPVYGQLDAPRRWYLEAVRRLCSRIQHALGPCLFMLFDEATPDPDQPDKSCLVGALCLHVDDMLGAGDPNNARYLEAESKLKEIFNFRTWEEDTQVLEYCGVKLHRKDFAWELEQEDFLRKVKPITLHKG